MAPVKVTKTKGGKFRVATPSRTTAKGTTKKKAESQARLLRAIEHDPSFKPRGSRKARKAR